MQHLLRKQIISCIILMVMFCTGLQAQRYEIYRTQHDDMPYYFGLTLGYNSCYLSPTKSKTFLMSDSVKVAEPGSSGGISLGLHGTLRLSRRFQLRFNPQLVLGGARYFSYTINPDYAKPGEPTSQTKTMPTTEWNFPLQIKFNSDRIGNFRTYLLFGGKYDINVVSSDGSATTFNNDWLLKLKKNDFGLEIGVGFNFFLEYFTLSPEIKFGYGLTNVLDRDPNLKYSSVFDKLQSRILMFSLHFED